MKPIGKFKLEDLIALPFIQSPSDAPLLQAYHPLLCSGQSSCRTLLFKASTSMVLQPSTPVLDPRGGVAGGFISCVFSSNITSTILILWQFLIKKEQAQSSLHTDKNEPAHIHISLFQKMN